MFEAEKAAFAVLGVDVAPSWGSGRCQVAADVDVDDAVANFAGAVEEIDCRACMLAAVEGYQYRATSLD